MKPKLIAALIVAALILVFVFQNSEVIRLKFYFWDVSMSQIILIPVILAVGFVLGFVVAKLTGKKRIR